MTDITVVIPVGPKENHVKWLKECLESVLNQSHKPKEILLINDTQQAFDVIDTFSQVLPNKLTYGGLHYTPYPKEYWFFEDASPPIRISCYNVPWNVGVPDAFNFGMALSDTNLVFMLGSDDTLMPECLAECAAEYEKQKVEGWYNVTIVTSSGEEAWIPNNAAMVTKKLWEWTGGFPPSAGIGACDALLLSILMVHAPDRILQVKQCTPLYWCRVHDQQDTPYHAGCFNPEVISVRSKETDRWTPKN